ncbi:hypothetical protein L227DRAFT_365415 [Lentinus tigrinus ALCF2SS1-6]|uniref:Hemerythrin-like domain-containing protein n=1 Tax=Lentinus tigrinus ALCF2SS1-6 TaxID=1328759 RepID=A0A5C2SJH9_9APHY|nr:hypothetical protein L227DRAFT_365415 [Lentinus tigrinus ALCF2SS1-6]
MSSVGTATNFLDVTHEIKLDHDNVRDLFERFRAASDRDEKATLANTLIREMAIHGDAEELSVYNDYSVLGLGDTAAHNKEEHHEIKQLVHKADTTSVGSPQYDEVISQAVTTFLTHAKEEEDEQHPIMRERLSPQDNDKLARAFLKARKMVPTRPHPAAPQTGGVAQKAAGAVGSLQDNVVEKAGGRQFAALKYAHPEF